MIDWIKEFGEPAPHVPETVVPLPSYTLFDANDPKFRNLTIRLVLTPLCESPIEIDLGAAMIEHAAGRFKVVPQYPLGRYRYDFAISGLDGTAILLVECDGRDFHSAPEQIANDRLKDAFAASIGLSVIRATGSEIHRDAAGVAEAIIGLAISNQSRGTKGGQ